MRVNAPNNSLAITTFKRTRETSNERGSALAGAILLLAVLGAIAMTVLGVVHTETRIAGSDLERTRTFYAAASGIEKMTSDFSALFARSSRPSRNQLDGIQLASPPELAFEGFQLAQTIDLDQPTLDSMRLTQGIGNDTFPTVTIPSGPYAGLTASVAPYNLITTANSIRGAEVRLNRQINNYLVPIFQFGMFSDEDISVHPGPMFTFNGRVHANGNLYLNGNTVFLARVTTANEAVVDVLRNGSVRAGNVSFQVGAINVRMTKGSVFGGPNLPGPPPDGRGDFPDSPNGNDNPAWTTDSKAAAQAAVPNQFGGQLLTRTTGITPLLLPLQLDGNSTREIIKRGMPNDSPTLSSSRYHNKSQIRILIDDQNPAAPDSSGIPAGQGELLDQFDPMPLPAGAPAAGGGRALWRINDNGNYTDNAGSCVQQQDGNQADTVRSPRSVTAFSPNGITIPAGAGLSGRILIEIIAPDGTAREVTREILSLGMTVGEPNAIVHLQRPLWAAFTQGSRDANGGTYSLTQILSNGFAADGEIEVSAGYPSVDANGNLLNVYEEATAEPIRKDTPDVAGNWNSIVPINIYNVREGQSDSVALIDNAVYERGVMSVVELNMRNLARWLDGVYDTNLLAGTNAVSGSINGAEGYIVYVSDRRGDKVKAEIDALGPITTTNGMVDNEDIYGPNGILDPGEDVIDAGTDVALGLPKKDSLQKDTTELPDPVELAGTSGADRFGRAITVAAWTNPNIFRRSVRLFNGENLQVTGAPGALSATKGITVASENMIYVWGNYNTTGVNGQPAGASTLNDPTQPFFWYLGNQVAASIVADACFPLSKTWADSAISMYPDILARRTADRNLPAFNVTTQETAVRAGIIAGNNLAALAGAPDAGNTPSGESRLNGGMHNFPRFLERWPNRWSFVGSLIPLFHSTQALGQYNSDGSIYSPPIRNWAFDTTFRDPNRLPPGTPQFQYVQPTAFRQVL